MSDTLFSSQQELHRALGNNVTFDLKIRPFMIGNRKAYFYYFIGYSDGIAMERILAALMALSPESAEKLSATDLMEKHLPFAAAEVTPSPQKAAEELLRGSALILLEDKADYLICDARDFLIRSPEEPEKDRTLRGPHIGLGESMIANLIQIRRHLRTADLTVERFLVGEKIPNEVAILGIRGKYDEGLMNRLREKLKNAHVPNLSMTQEGLSSLLFPLRGLAILNPFPRVRYTERPDVIAATLMEGKIAVLCDNTPSVMLLPECLFDFFEETDDYYFPPVTASYLRIVRSLVFLCSVFLIPLWLLAVRFAHAAPEQFQALVTNENYTVPLFLQFLMIEFAIDGLKMASLNTPSTLSGSFSVIGGLLLGEFAVKSGWFIPQTILYSAFTAIANFIPTNYELGYSFKFMRITLILGVTFFGQYGLLGGILLWTILLISTKSAAGRGYLYPILPFDRKGLMKIFLRTVKGRERE